MGYISDLESSEIDSEDYADVVEHADAPFDKFDIDVKQVKHYTIADVLTTDKAKSNSKSPKKCKLKPRQKDGPRLKKTDHRVAVY